MRELHEIGVDVDEDLKAGAMGPVGRTDKAGAFDEEDLAASSRSCGSDLFFQVGKECWSCS